MRTGLVALGVVIAILGAGLVLTLFFLSSGPSTTTQITPQDPSLTPTSPQNWVVPGATGGSGSITLNWAASARADVDLWPAATCTAPGGFCSIGVPVLNWSNALNGSGTIATASGSAYILIVGNPGNAPLRFSGTVSITYTPGRLVSALSWGLIAAGGITLLTIGGIALFLGLYLPGGVYRDRGGEPVARRHPSLPPDDPEDETFEEPP